jgi:hypothetical protein
LDTRCSRARKVEMVRSVDQEQSVLLFEAARCRAGSACLLCSLAHWALAQLWLFWVAPLIGGALGGALYRWLT